MQPPVVPKGKLVVAHPERKAQRALQRLVGATLCPVEVVDSIDALKHAVDGDAIGVVDAVLAREHPELLQQPARAWIAVPGEGLAAADPACLDALLTAGWSHVVSHPMPLLAEELLATVQKLLRTDVFGLEKYMAWGAEVRTYTLEDATERDAAVGALAKDVVAVGLPDRVGSMVSVIADELIANALFVAPIDADGKRHRVNDNREQPRPLGGKEVVTVRWATDARYLAIEVRDSWGTMDPMAIGPRLASTTKQAPTEGGMGLPLVYACCNQFVVQVQPGERTEVITLLDVRYKPTELGRGASFHAFGGK